MSLEQFSIIESTLREGEQFVNAFFTTEQKVDHCPDAGRIWGRVYRTDHTLRFTAERKRLPGHRRAGPARQNPDPYPLRAGRCEARRRYRRRRRGCGDRHLFLPA